MKKLIIIRGASGSGKSTFAKTIASTFKDAGVRVIVVEADDYFYNESGEYNFDPKQLQDAHNWCQDRAETAMMGGIDVVIVSNTNTSCWEYEPYIEMAKEFCYSVDCIVKENLHGGESVHHVGQSVVEKQRDRIRKSLKL